MQITFEKLRVDENCLFHYQSFRQEKFTSAFHVHDEFELILIVKSRGKLFIGNEITNFSEGDIFLFAPGVPHCFHNSKGLGDEDNFAHALVIQFRHDFLGEDFFNKTESIQLKKLIHLSKSGFQLQHPSARLKNRIVKMDKCTGLHRLEALLFVLNELGDAKDYKLLTKAQVILNLAESKTINDVIQYVADNFQNDLTLAHAAKIANMQKSAFCRYFKRKTKKRFMEFVNETRLVHAQKLLLETDKNILEIAYESGYESVSYFYRLFRQYNAMSPVNYRHQALNKHPGVSDVSETV